VRRAAAGGHDERARGREERGDDEGVHEVRPAVGAPARRVGGVAAGPTRRHGPVPVHDALGANEAGHGARPRLERGDVRARELEPAVVRHVVRPLGRAVAAVWRAKRADVVRAEVHLVAGRDGTSPARFWPLLGHAPQLSAPSSAPKSPWPG
jgi:hypothetical protein